MKKAQNPGTDGQKHSTARLSKGGLTLILALVVILFLLINYAPTPLEPPPASVKTSLPKHAAHGAKKENHSAAEPAVDPPAPLVPKPMNITKKILVTSKWNSGTNAFGMKGPKPGEEGASWGPASVASVNDDLYVMDNVHGRLLRYDKEGRELGEVRLTNPSMCGDLVANPSDSSLWVIDSDFNTIYKVKGNEVTSKQSVPTRDLTDRSLWGYDAASDTLFCRDTDKGGDVPVLRNGQVISPSERTAEHLSEITPELEGRENLVLDLGKGRNIRIAFGQPVECVEQIVTDGQGMVWMLYNLTGDFRMRRLARIDPAGHTIGVATLNDVWFAVDGSRHMTATSSGVVLFVGSQQEGKLLAYDYAGGAL